MKKEVMIINTQILRTTQAIKEINYVQISQSIETFLISFNSQYNFYGKYNG